MINKKSKNCAISLVLVLVGVFCAIVPFVVKFNMPRYLEMVPILVLGVFSAVCIYFSACFLFYNAKLLKLILLIYFIVYCAFIVYITLFSSFFERKIELFFLSDFETLRFYVGVFTPNIIPFKNIVIIFVQFIKGETSLSRLAVNVLGNIVIFMPFALFLPLLIKRLNSLTRFTYMMTAIVLFVEMMQALLMCGTADIDDVILNVGGAALMYIVIWNTKISRLVYKYTQNNSLS